MINNIYQRGFRTIHSITLIFVFLLSGTTFASAQTERPVSLTSNSAMGGQPFSPIDAVKISIGENLSCAIGDDNQVYCWGGFEPASGRKSNLSPVFLPVKVSLLDFWAKEISVGKNHACLINGRGDVMCWGQNTFGQSGYSSKFGPIKKPAKLYLANSTYVKLSSGDDHSCALSKDQSVFCWGSNQYGQVGTGKTGYESEPFVALNTYEQIIQISAGGRHTCALSALGIVK